MLNEQKEGIGWEKDALELLKNELVKLKHCLHKTQIQRQAYAAQHQTTKKQCNSLKRQQKNLDAKQKSGIQSMELHINRNDLAEQKKLMHSLLSLHDIKKHDLILQMNEAHLINRIKHIEQAYSTLNMHSQGQEFIQFENIESVFQYIQQTDARFPLMTSSKEHLKDN